MKSYIFGRYEAVGDGVNRQGGHRTHVQFVANVLAVRDDRGQGDTQLVCNLFVYESADYQGQHFGLAGREIYLRVLGKDGCMAPWLLFSSVGMLEQGEDAL